MNEDITQFARVDTSTLEWSPSPSAGVWRKRCYLAGDTEKSAVTSVVRYDPESAFPTHQHPDGEELFVIDGVFEDDTGHYGPGSFILNPPGSEHAPSSEPGCRLFVRLRQHHGSEPVRIATLENRWQTDPDRDDIATMPLWSDDLVEHRLVRLDPGATLGSVDVPHGKELFVLSGSLEDEHGEHPAETWLRYPSGACHNPASPQGCTVLVKEWRAAR